VESLKAPQASPSSVANWWPTRAPQNRGSGGCFESEVKQLAIYQQFQREGWSVVELDEFSETGLFAWLCTGARGCGWWMTVLSADLHHAA